MKRSGNSSKFLALLREDQESDELGRKAVHNGDKWLWMGTKHLHPTPETGRSSCNSSKCCFSKDILVEPYPGWGLILTPNPPKTQKTLFGSQRDCSLRALVEHLAKPLLVPFIGRCDDDSYASDDDDEDDDGEDEEEDDDLSIMQHCQTCTPQAQPGPAAWLGIRMILHDPKLDPKPQISPPESQGYLKMDEEVAFTLPNFS
ncbi:hypothetical protein TURU_098918 [Turdus rufiventris]|nr:hypothetical protein TURU_098918 [Turdus rufiventris]